MRGMIDDAANVLRAAGWSAGDMLLIRPNGTFWLVYAYRGEHRIVAKAESQVDAWREAVAMALKLSGRSAESPPAE
jgi:hypothetical protein